MVARVGLRVERVEDLTSMSRQQKLFIRTTDSIVNQQPPTTFSAFKNVRSSFQPAIVTGSGFS